MLRVEGIGMEAMIREYLLMGRTPGPAVSLLRVVHSELQQKTCRLAMDSASIALNSAVHVSQSPTGFESI